MVDHEDRRIIESEIARLERLWSEAQERYGYSGSRSTERTMTKYRILIGALERALNASVYTNALETTNAEISKRLIILHETIVRLGEGGEISGDVATLLGDLTNGV